MNLEQMYQEIILDHYRRPTHAGLRDPFDVQVHHVNPMCGDEVSLRVLLENSSSVPRVGDVSYTAQGCSISQASTSVMSDLVIGRAVPEALDVEQEFLALMQGKGEIEPDEDVLGDAVAFSGVARYPARIKCALLGWMAFKDAAARAVANHEERRETA